MKPLRILLISGNREVLPDPVAPLGLAWVAAALREAGHQVLLKDLCFSPEPEAECRQLIGSFQPDLVGLSIRNIDNVESQAARSYIPELAAVVGSIRAETDAPVLLGGSGFTLLPEETLAALGADMGVAGEGERAAVTLANRLARGEPVDDVPGIVLPGRSVPPEHLPLEDLPDPARDLLDNTRYLELGGSANVQTKRGCGAGCIYCTYPLIQGRRIRLREPERVVREMSRARRDFGCSHFYVVDNQFNDPPEHALEVAQALTRLDPTLGWSCYATPTGLNQELVETMRRGGCTGVELGIDSAHPAMLERLGKDFSQETILESARLCREVRLPFCFTLLLGGPGETEETVEETFRICREADPDAVIIMIGVRVYPGTPLAGQARREGFLASGQNLLEPWFYPMPGLDAGVLGRISEQANRERSWVIPGDGLKLSRRIQDRARQSGFRGPLWEYLARLRMIRGITGKGKK